MDSGQVALVAVIASVIGPLLLSSMSSRQRRIERREDWARQDELEKRTVEAQGRAQRAVEQTRVDLANFQQQQTAAGEITARLLLADNEQTRAEAAHSFGETQAQLEQIHTLVNSELTEAQRRERDATVAMLATMREVVTLKQRSGIEPSPETLAAMDEIRERIDILSQSLEHKQEQTRLANEARSRHAQP